MYQVHNEGTVETTPLVFDGVMYITEPQTVVTALDLRTGRQLWTWERVLPKDLNPIGFGRVNRGVAVLGNTVVCRHAGCASWSRSMRDRARFAGMRRWPITRRDIASRSLRWRSTGR